MASWSAKARTTTSGLSSSALLSGQRYEDLEREYLENYHSIDERVPRFRQLPARRLVHITALYTAEELKTSPTYNEILPRAAMQDGLNVRLPGLDGSHIGWGLNDPVDSEGWGDSRIAMVQGLLPHIQQFVRVRQALVRAGARTTTVTALLDSPRIGVLELERRGRIMAANDRAHTILAARRWVGGPGRDAARPQAGRPGPSRTAGGRRAAGLWRGRGQWVDGAPPLVVHVKPVGVPQPDHGARHVAALVLIVDPGASIASIPTWWPRPWN